MVNGILQIKWCGKVSESFILDCKLALKREDFNNREEPVKRNLFILVLFYVISCVLFKLDAELEIINLLFYAHLDFKLYAKLNRD